MSFFVMLQSAKAEGTVTPPATIPAPTVYAGNSNWSFAYRLTSQAACEAWVAQVNISYGRTFSGATATTNTNCRYLNNSGVVGNESMYTATHNAFCTNTQVSAATGYGIGYTGQSGNTTTCVLSNASLAVPNSVCSGNACTCNTGYAPNAGATACVVACPAHAHGTPCACDAGYQFDAAGASCVSACPVSALTAPPFNDACAEVLENINSTQAQKDAACGALTPALQAGKACLETKLAGMSSAIPMKVTSDIRSVAYQAHLREIWDKMERLVRLENDPDKRSACATRRAEIAAEKGCDNAGPCESCYAESAIQRSHCLKGRPAYPNPNDAQHTQGNAFDVSEARTIEPLLAALGARNPPETIPQFLDAPPTNCNLNWGGSFTDNYDPIHFYAR